MRRVNGQVDLEKLRTIRDGSGHSIFGPSASHMFLACPGSLVPNLLAPDNGNKDAAYGTVAHEVTETWLRIGKRPVHLIGRNRFIEAGNWGFLVWIDEEMLAYAEMCVEYVDFLEGERFVEQRVDFSRITPIPNQSGTADLIVLQDDTAFVVDWKFGKGHQVFAQWNTQGMLYALGAIWKYDPDGKIKKIVIRIGQPRLDHFDEWVVSRDELMEFAGWAKARMALAWNPEAPRIPGPKQCQWCKVRSSCAAFAEMQVRITEEAFSDLDVMIDADEMQGFKDRLDDTLDEFALQAVEVGTLTTGQLAKLRPFRGIAERWWKSLDAELMHRAANGEDLTAFGHKIVESRSHRGFPNPEQAIARLTELGIDRKAIVQERLASPAEAERLLLKAGYRRKEIPELLEGHTRKLPGKPTIAPLHDKRPALVDMSGVAFDNLDSEDDEDGEL
jgi:hypothetical protein